MTPPHDSAAGPTAAGTDPGPVPEGVVCPDCGYDLRGLLSDRCPECGGDILALRRQESFLPWRHRAERGRLRAFWQTVWWVTFCPRRFRREVAVPQPLTDARRFWLVSYVHVVAVLTLLGAAAYWYASATESADFGAWPWVAIGCGAVVALITLWLLPGLATYFLQTRRFSAEYEERVRALSLYMWGAVPLFLIGGTVLVAGLLLLRTQIRQADDDFRPEYVITLRRWMRFAISLLVSVSGLLAVLPQLHLYFLARRLLYRGRLSAVTTVVLFNLAALTLPALLALIPLSIFYFVLVYLSVTMQ